MKNKTNIINKIKRLELELKTNMKQFSDFETLYSKTMDKLGVAYERKVSIFDKKYQKLDNYIARKQEKLNKLLNQLNPPTIPKYTHEEINKATKILKEVGFKVVKVIKKER